MVTDQRPPTVPLAPAGVQPAVLHAAKDARQRRPQDGLLVRQRAVPRREEEVVPRAGRGPQAPIRTSADSERPPPSSGDPLLLKKAFPHLKTSYPASPPPRPKHQIGS